MAQLELSFIHSERMDLIVELIKTFWILIPAYIANATPPLAKGKRPIDFGKYFLGQRLFGSNKTIEGFVFGVFCGTITGLIEMFIYQKFLISSNNPIIHELPIITLQIAFLISFGAMCGDLAGSFIKRRFKIPPGANVPILDQLNFIVGVIIFIYPFIKLNIIMILIMFILTPIFHKIANVIAYFLKIKKVPW